MLSRILEAMTTHEFLPLYHMADGEYAFALSKFPIESLPFWQLSLRQMAGRIKRIVSGKAGYHKSGSAEYGWETYNIDEKRVLREKFINDFNHYPRP